VHDHRAEHLEVRSGEFTFLLDGEEKTPGVGESESVEPGT
jgi:hypothetical protein